jgi:tRNA threonylcarbamoyladenosine biosynthesis protein TsaB
MNPVILGIETSTLSCSVALFSRDGLLHSAQKCDAQHVHASHLLPMISEALEAHGKSPHDLSAVAVCAGPGSYTGLRIGVSTAKGLCHAMGIPLIAINSLEIQAYEALESIDEGSTIVAVMDARRDEVYTQTFERREKAAAALDETRALVIEAQASIGELFPAASEDTFVIGDAAEKTKTLLGDRAQTWNFKNAHPQAAFLQRPALAAFEAQAFEDVAYFEPRYLKEFQAGKPKDPLGLRKNKFTT